MTVAMRAIVAHLVVLGLVTGLLLALCAARFLDVQRTLVQSRMMVTGNSIRDAIEGAVDLGMQVDQVRNADPLIRRALESDWHIRSINIVGSSGRVLFASGTPVVPAGAGFAMAGEPPSGPTIALRDADIVIRTPVGDSLGQGVATVEIVYDGSPTRTALLLHLRRQVPYVALILLVAVAMTIGGFHLVMRRSPIAYRWSAAAGQDAAAALPPDIATMIAAAEAHAAAIGRALDELEDSRAATGPRTG